MPTGVFQHLHGNSFEVGRALVKHPFTKGVGFTGSLTGGKALYDIAQQRLEPIPVFAEMSSINPVILLPKSLASQAEKSAELLAGSITLGVGQFCTNPGLIIAIEGDGLNQFIEFLSKRIGLSPAGTMLHTGISDNYAKRLTQSLIQKGIEVVGQSSAIEEKNKALPTIASIKAIDFLKNPLLSDEVFGPYSLLVKCNNLAELHAVVNQLHGQLTTSIFGSEEEISSHSSLLNMLTEKTGRMIINGVPTGVEVCPSMQHGGPYPSTTDARFTSVGVDAIKRFVRPVAFQNFPTSLLPEELKDNNPLKIWRLVNNGWSKN
jgi:NADP-dependent aldehyde dehydrogenase